jgi:hypothetical protein
VDALAPKLRRSVGATDQQLRLVGRSSKLHHQLTVHAAGHMLPAHDDLIVRPVDRHRSRVLTKTSSS